MPLVPLQLSLAVTPPKTFGTAAWQVPSALALVGAGQLTVGTVVRSEERRVGQVALLPASSVAVTVMVFVPNPTSVPAAGDWTRVIPLVPLQLSLARSEERRVGKEGWPLPSAAASNTNEQLTVGTVVSVTVKVVVQVTMWRASSGG